MPSTRRPATAAPSAASSAPSVTSGPPARPGDHAGADPARTPFVEFLRDPDAFRLADPRWARFARAALAVAVVAVLAVASVNVGVNPRAEFPHRLVAPIVTEASHEKAVALRSLDEPPELLVLGTSRAAVLEPTLGGHSGYNLAIPGGNLLDIRDAYRLATREQGKPQVVVLGLDSFQFSQAAHASRYFDQAEAGWAYQGEGRTVADWAGLVAGTVSASYSRDSLVALRLAVLGTDELPFFTYRPDGVQDRPRQDAQRAAGAFDVAHEVDLAWPRVAARYPDDAVVSEQAAQMLLEFVQDLRAGGIGVYVYLTPFHDEALARLQGMQGFVALDVAARGVLPALCDAGANAFDYTQVETWNGIPDGFYDGYHMTPENNGRLRVALEQGIASACIEDALPPSPLPGGSEGLGEAATVTAAPPASA